MGELSFLTEKLISVFMGKLFEGVSLVVSFREEFSFICDELISIQCLFNDAEEIRKYTTMSNWLDKLEDFLVDAVDVVKECSATSKWDLRSRYFMSLKMNSLKKRIIKIHQSGKYVKYLTGIGDANAYNIEDRRGRSSALFGRDCDYQPVGMDEDIKAISALIKKKDGPRVIAVVGMGGLGKTLLVQHVFHALKSEAALKSEESSGFSRSVWLAVSKKFVAKELLLEKSEASLKSEESSGFSRFVWLAVSKKFEAKELLLEIGRQTYLETDQSKNLHLTTEELRCITYKHLAEQTCLFVLDDLWQEDTLEKIGLPLEKGNKILLTSRHKSIAKIIPDHYIHTMTARTLSATENSSGLLKIYTMTALDHDNSYILFKRHAFPPDTDDLKLGLESLANVIAAKCGGLPLAVKTIAGYMATVKRVPNEWELTLRRLKELEAITHKVMPSLRLSYQGLPYHIKQCFMYCSVFPKSSIMESQHLLHAWIAEGFVSTQEAAEDPYDVARCYMDELVDRCLIEPSEVGGDGRGLSFKMHDLLHDLALSEFQKQSKCMLRPQEELENFPDSVGFRRISLIQNKISRIEGAIPSPGLRTLFLSYNNLASISKKFFKKLEYLSVLDLSGTLIKSLPDSIGSMKHLKFLNLSYTNIEMLPESLSDLEYLQYLDVSKCSFLKKLHAGIGKHKSMIYLNAEGCAMLASVPVGMSELVHLRTLKLDAVFPRPVKTRGLCREGVAIAHVLIKKLMLAHFSALQLRDLKGLIHLQHLSLVVDCTSQESDQLEKTLEETFKDMTKMQTLCLRNISSSPELPKLPDQMKNMQHLQNLSLLKWGMPTWIDQLQSLTELQLEGNQPCYDGLQRIPNLKKLHMFNEDSRSEFPTQFQEPKAFPKLEELTIQNYSLLAKFPSLHEGAMPILKRLQIQSCEMLQMEEDMVQELERRIKSGLQVIFDSSVLEAIFDADEAVASRNGRRLERLYSA